MNFINIYSHISVKPTTDICIIYLTLFAVALLFTFIYFFFKKQISLPLWTSFFSNSRFPNF